MTLPQKSRGVSFMKSACNQQLYIIDRVSVGGKIHKFRQRPSRVRANVSELGDQLFVGLGSNNKCRQGRAGHKMVKVEASSQENVSERLE